MEGELQEGGTAELPLPLEKEGLPLTEVFWQDKVHHGGNTQLQDAAEKTGNRRKKQSISSPHFAIQQTKVSSALKELWLAHKC